MLLLFRGVSHAQWQPDVRLTNDPAFTSTSNNNAWSIAANGDVLHVVWWDFRDGNWEIYYKRSADGGTKWGADTRLTIASNDSWNPSVSVSAQVVHVVWMDRRDGNYEIYYKRSTDEGVSWGADTRLTNNSAISGSPSVSVSGQILHVVWHDSRDGVNEIYYKRSTDGGVSWGADTRLTNNPGNSIWPSISVSGQVVHVVWMDRLGATHEIHYIRSTDGGTSWETDTQLTNDPANSVYPSVSLSGSVVHIVWQEDRDGNYEIYYKRSTDGGVNWGVDIRLTNAPDDSQNPSVSVSGQVVHVVWNDLRDVNSEIYYKRSTDGGISWEADMRLTNDPAASSGCFVSVSGVVLHVVWQDYRDENYEIYYKRNPTGNPTPTLAISGTVTYGNVIGAPTPRFVSNVTISGAGSPNVFTTTAAPGPIAGQYSLTGFGSGSYTVTPTKTGGVNGAISSFDAGRIALHVAGLPNPQLNATQLIVADVSGNGTISSFDAGQIARYAAGVPGSGSAGTWIFMPVNRSYASVTGNVTGEDFVALLMGEVSGSWTNAGARPAGSRP